MTAVILYLSSLIFATVAAEKQGGFASPSPQKSLLLTRLPQHRQNDMARKAVRVLGYRV